MSKKNTQKIVMKPDEMGLLKGLAIKLADDVALLVTLQYTADRKDTGKTVRGTSRYRYLCRVTKVSDLNDQIREMKLDQNQLNRWKWPDDPSWDGYIFRKHSTSSEIADFLRMKVKKMVDWDLGMKILDGFVKCKNEFNPTSKYETEGYLDPDGNVVSLKDKDALLKLVGKNIVKELKLKRDLKKEAKEATKEVILPEASTGDSKENDLQRETA